MAKQSRTSFKIFAGLLAAAAVCALVYGACLNTGLNCGSTPAPCGLTCVNPQVDRLNCSACGIACQIGQVCQRGACICEEGTTSCNGFCVVVSSDPLNCGGCAGDGGSACAVNQVCEQGQCKAACTLESSRRCAIDGGIPTCVDVTTDRNCGDCGNQCLPGQRCLDRRCVVLDGGLDGG